MMKQTLKFVLAGAIALVAAGCTQSEIAAAMAGLTTGVSIADAQDNGDCDNWYDFLDPGCY